MKRTKVTLKSSYCSIIHSLRLAPSVSGVAVASQVLCTSTTLNKRTHNIEFSYLHVTYTNYILLSIEILQTSEKFLKNILVHIRQLSV